jgi:hypothetical protein
MSKKLSWDKIAKHQYDNMDAAERESFRELRSIVYGE